MDVKVTVNGETYERDVEPRKLLIHFLRDDLDLTGSHIGCDTGNCGACSVIAAPYAAHGKVLGVLGVIGPTRMAYDRVIPIVQATARILGNTLNRG